MRVATDGYIDIGDGQQVRTPGYHDHTIEPVPEAEALSYNQSGRPGSVIPRTSKASSI